ncbi:hypothetical protein L7F22_002823 [Adiantum nelumboides]|nr:hypothetical protein [Adiantum nelumboides]
MSHTISKEAQERIVKGGRKGGRQTRAEQLGSEGYKEMGSKGGQARGRRAVDKKKEVQSSWGLKVTRRWGVRASWPRLTWLAGR